MKLPNINKSKKPTRVRVLQALLLCIGALIIIGTGTYVVFASKNAKDANESAVSTKFGIGAASTVKDTGSDSTTADSESTASTAGTTSGSSTTSTGPTFTFVDTSEWVNETSRDGTFTIRYKSDRSYAPCRDLADNLMIEMAGPSDGDCGSLQEIVSVQPNTDHTAIMLRTMTVMAQTDDVWDRSGASPVTVVLTDGVAAQRYGYDSTILNKQYHTIEYDMMSYGKRYVIVDNWPIAQQPNMSINDFDTMVQKTLVFN